MTAHEQHRLMVEYLKLKVEQADWHAVSDAANDLREIEARNPELASAWNKSFAVPTMLNHP